MKRFFFLVLCAVLLFSFAGYALASSGDTEVTVTEDVSGSAAPAEDEAVTEKDGWHFNAKGFLVGENPGDEYLLEDEKNGTWQYSSTDLAVTITRTQETVKVKAGKVTFKKAGSYTVKYFVKGKNGRTSTKKVTYKVVDKRVLSELKAKKVYVEYGTKFKPYSFIQGITTYKGTALKIKSRNVSVEGNVDTTVPGTYKVVYTISDGNQKYTRITRTLIVVVKEKPEEPKPEEETTPIDDTNPVDDTNPEDTTATDGANL